MPPQQSVLQVALVPGELPQSAPPEGALPIVYADRVVGWATPTIARVEDAEAVAAFRALDVPLGWRVRAVLEPVPPAAAPLVLGGTITSAGEAISTPAAEIVGGTYARAVNGEPGGEAALAKAIDRNRVGYRGFE